MATTVALAPWLCVTAFGRFCSEQRTDTVADVHASACMTTQSPARHIKKRGTEILISVPLFPLCLCVSV
ncbi:MAG: hypothetical protein AVDCRST_MAG68-519 [uncultured Gemmatimonadetes bacterium]|uniref:Uncharacterized protein n=1 Tax=uncultured Gemmatimonadota bacterium TaxID=203437 RepID=A0A6J4KAC7_9BACT|nr:MAG: hypothetical protein AVDCRST_MAG68-519 [uncultured Gemmatimonadota bacterium]